MRSWELRVKTTPMSLSIAVILAGEFQVNPIAPRSD